MYKFLGVTNTKQIEQFLNLRKKSLRELYPHFLSALSKAYLTAPPTAYPSLSNSLSNSTSHSTSHSLSNSVSNSAAASFRRHGRDLVVLNLKRLDYKSIKRQRFAHVSPCCENMSFRRSFRSIVRNNYRRSSCSQNGTL